MNKLILITNLILASSLPVSKTDSPIPYKEVRADNNCFINATGYKDAYNVKMDLEKRYKWARLIYVEIPKVTGHCITAFYYDGCWRTYDPRVGSMVISDSDKIPEPKDFAKIDKDYVNAAWYK